jgi:multiple sugar transport system permease protein
MNPKRRRIERVVLHVVLWIGAFVFALPFVWLATTSLKWDREVFSERGGWLSRLVPRLPYRVVRTPYVAVDDAGDFEKPSRLDGKTWEPLLNRLEPLLWDAIQPDMARREIPDPLRNDIRHAVTRDLWNRVVAELPDDLWSQPLSRIQARVVAAVTPEKIQASWDLLYRSIRLGTPTVQTLDRSDYNVGNVAWATVRGEARLVRVQENGVETTEVWTDFRQSPRPPYATLLYATLKLPADAKQLRAITLPVRGDESYHHFTAAVELGGNTYASDEPILLRNYAWQEITLQFQGERLPHERENVMLDRVEPSTEVSGSREARVTLTLHRARYPVAVYRKFARNYEDAATFVRFWRFAWNTVVVTSLSIAAQLLSCSLVAFAFARLRWPLRNALFLLLLSTMMLPGQVTMIPVFLIMRALGFYDTLTPLWVGSLFGSAFFIFLVRQFLLGVPRDLEDAAKIDGCGYFGIYWRIMLPLVKPALAAIAIFQFMGSWNDFLGPLIYVSSERNTTLSLGLQMFQSLHTNEFGMLMAASTAMTLPVVAIFFFAQRYFIQGVTLTGMKG